MYQVHCKKKYDKGGDIKGQSSFFIEVDEKVGRVVKTTRVLTTVDERGKRHVFNHRHKESTDSCYASSINEERLWDT